MRGLSWAEAFVVCLVVQVAWVTARLPPKRLAQHGEVIDVPLPPHSSGVMPRVPDDVIPTSWDWRSVGGFNYVPPVRNQHAPSTDPKGYCGSCWAFSTLAMLNTRYAIMHHADPDFRPIELSPQELMNCGEAGSCSGGSAPAVLQYGMTQGFTDETCNPYLALDLECSGFGAHCYTCWSTTGCVPVTTYLRYFVDTYGSVSGEANMMQEIFARGPVVCLIHDPDTFKHLNSSDVYVDWSGEKWATHYISIVGWGVSNNGTKFWHVLNSWGTAWNLPLGGYAKVMRSVDTLGIESNGCTWGTLRKDTPIWWTDH